MQVAGAGKNRERTYRKKTSCVERPKEEWIAVPVPDSGIPREWVDAARDAIMDNDKPSSAGHRVWELSGGIIECATCGWNMMVQSVSAPRLAQPGRLFYYRCRKRNRDGAEGCSHRKCHRADQVESRVWDHISRLLKDPERLRAGLEEMIEQERAGLRGDPDQEAKTWLEKLSEVDQERRGYLRLAAKGRLTDEELDEALAELETTRQSAEKELSAIRARRQVLENLERDRDALLESYASMTPASLDALSPEERHQVYKMLRLTVEISPDGSLDVSGILGYSFVSENQDESLARTQQFPRRRRQANVEVIGVHANILPVGALREPPLHERPLHPLGVADETVWVDVFQGTGCREFFDLLAGQLPTARADVALELLQRAGADDRGGNAILPEEPVQ